MDSSDFILEEYKHLTDSFLRNEELGERRVNFFLTFTTTAIGALVAAREFFNDVEMKNFYIGFCAVLLALLLFGIVTLMRIIHRNLVTDKYLRGLARIRRYYADVDKENPNILPYLPYKTFDDFPQRKKKGKDIYSLGNGGLLETVALVNSIITAALLALFAFYRLEWRDWNLWLAPILGFVFTWSLQFIHTKRSYDAGEPKIEDIHFPSPKEIEAALIIKSENPQIIAKQISEMTSIADYRLVPQESEIIHDIYFDTTDGRLHSKKIALRIRTIGLSNWITIKGPSRRTWWGGVKRLEIEKLWSKNALTEVLNELEYRGIKMKIHQLHQDFENIHPLAVMSNLGLKVIQDRESHRKPMNIKYKDNSSVLAELVIDYTIYHFSKQDICLYEVEIESKVENDFTVLKTVIDNLFKIYKPALQKWDHSKLAMGKAIEKLSSEGMLKGMLNINNLEPEAYDQINAILLRGDI